MYKIYNNKHKHCKLKSSTQHILAKCIQYVWKYLKASILFKTISNRIYEEFNFLQLWSEYNY